MIAQYPALTQKYCQHCAQLVVGQGVIAESETVFCCEGCANVYTWLHQSQRTEYYEFLRLEGKRAPQAFVSGEYNTVLNSFKDPVVVKTLGRWKVNVHTLTLYCEQITCAGCAWLLENILQGREGIQTFEVDFIHNEVYLEYDSTKTSLFDVLKITSELGYALKPKNISVIEKPKVDRTLLYRLAVSGSCFANAMAFALAVYSGALSGMSKWWAQSFGWMGILISIPAVVYSAFPFLSGALRAIKTKQFNIDVTISIGIFLSFTLTVYSAIHELGNNYADSLTGLIFFLLLGRWAMRKFEASLALKGRWFDAFRPNLIKVHRNNCWETVVISSVMPGELIQVLAGEYVPLDGTLHVPSAWLDTSLLTGESRPTHFTSQELLFGGYRNLKEAITLRVTSSVDTSRIASLGQQLDELVRGRRSIPDSVGPIAKWFTIVVIGCGIITLGLHIHAGFAKALAAAASVFIISCACALALAAPISRGLGLKRAKQLGFYFKNQNSLESLKEIRCVLFDKTGTLTFTHRTISAWNWIQPIRFSASEEKEFLSAIKKLAQRSLHPVSVSLFKTLESMSDTSWELVKAQEIIHYGMVGDFTLRGNQEKTHKIAICKWSAFASDCAHMDSEFKNRTHTNDVSGADTGILLDGDLIAWIQFTDEIKPDVAAMVSELQKNGVTSVLLSGDNDEKVKKFAHQSGFRYFHSALTPEKKKAWATHYQSDLGPCLAVGDGFNDNLLFAESSMAMAIYGGAVDLSKATDILYTGGRPSDLTALFYLGKRVSNSIRISFWVSGLYNVGAITLAMLGKVNPLFAAILMPLSSLSLCLVALLVIRIPRN